MNNATFVANELTTRYEGKKHGGYNIYEDDKIEIAYDTYYPNLSVYVKDGDKKVLVLLRSGHGYNQEYHSGLWEKYIEEVLYPRALEANKKRLAEMEVREQIEKASKSCAINDAHIFNAKPPEAPHAR